MTRNSTTREKFETRKTWLEGGMKIEAPERCWGQRNGPRWQRARSVAPTGAQQPLSITLRVQKLVRSKSLVDSVRHLVAREMFSQIGLPSESLVADGAHERGVQVALRVLGHRLFPCLWWWRSGFVPSPMRCQVGWAVKHFITLRAPVFYMHYSRTTMLG